MTRKDLKKILLKAVESYNHYRKPEAKARLVRVRGNRFVVDFSAPFYWGCGIYDFFEDLTCEVKNLSQVEAKVLDSEPIGIEKYRVKYVIGSL